MTRVWEFSDNKAIPLDLVREQDFILRIRRLQRLATPHFVVNLALNSIEALAKNRRALEATEEQLKEFAKVTNGSYVDMSNGDAFVIWEETSDAEILASRLMAVLSPDTPHSPEANPLLFIFHLPHDYSKLRERANHYVEVVQAAKDAPAPGPADALKSEAARGPLTPWSVDQIGRLIADLDLKLYIRTQSIYALSGADHWTSVRKELYISFEDLRRERFPKLDVITPEHLFLVLCEMIDEQLLRLLTKNPEMISNQPINLNLSVAAVIGATFTQFTLGIPRAQRDLITFELHRGDLFQDFSRTLDAIKILKNEGFKIALDGISPDMLPFLNVAAFGADLIKVNVARERVQVLNDPAVRKAFAALNPQKIVFFRCDSEEALRAGRSLGVSLFQGWLIDDLTSTPSTHG